MDTKKNLQFAIDGLEMGFPNRTQICYGELPGDANALIVAVEDVSFASVTTICAAAAVSLFLTRRASRSKTWPPTLTSSRVSFPSVPHTPLHSPRPPPTRTQLPSSQIARTLSGSGYRCPLRSAANALSPRAPACESVPAECVCVCVCVCARARARACVRACVRAGEGGITAAWHAYEKFGKNSIDR